MKSYMEVLRATKHKVRGHKLAPMKEQMKVFETLDENLMPDMYGTGSVIESFQNQMAEVLGKEASVFFPSGTMAQQIALRIWCDREKNKKVAYHPLCHLEIHEQDGLKELHGIKTVLLGDKERLFTLEDLVHLGQVAVVLFELPQREIGGQLPSWNDLLEMVMYLKSRGIHTHLDGARLFECLPYYEKSAQEVCELFDSVYISFYKGLAGVTGAILAGEKAFTEKSKVWKRRHGGDLYHLYPYVVTASHAYELRKDRMQGYYEQAVEYASKLSQVEGIKILPEVPVCNMFHVHFDETADDVMRQLIKVMESSDVALFGGLQNRVNGLAKAEIYIGDEYGLIGDEKIDRAIAELKQIGISANQKRG